MNHEKIWSLLVLALSAAGLAWTLWAWVRVGRGRRRLDRLRRFLQ